MKRDDGVSLSKLPFYCSLEQGSIYPISSDRLFALDADFLEEEGYHYTINHVK